MVDDTNGGKSAPLPAVPDDGDHPALLPAVHDTNGGIEPPAPPLPAVEEPDAVRVFFLSVVPADWDAGFIHLFHMGPEINPDTGKKAFPLAGSGTNIDELMAAVACLIEVQGREYYFCLSRQRVRGRRRKLDALAFSSAWMDIDIKPDDPENHYTTLEEALEALDAFCRHYKLPPPSFIVFTGGGIHVYWASIRVLSDTEWRTFAEALKAAAIEFGLKADHNCTADAARVLRVPGTLNWKYGEPRRVEFIPDRCPRTKYAFAAAFASIVGMVPPIKLRNSAAPIEPVAPAFADIGLGDLGAGIERPPPLPLDAVTKECGWMHAADETGGKTFDQPQWHLSVLCATFMEDGHEVAHRISRGHAAYQYAETEAMWVRKSGDQKAKDLGYPSCLAIASAGSKFCKTCPHYAEGKNPFYFASRPDAPAPTATQQEAPSNGGSAPTAPAAQPPLPMLVAAAKLYWGVAPVQAANGDYWFEGRCLNSRTGDWFDLTTDTCGNKRDLMNLFRTKMKPKTKEAVLVCAADIVPKPVEWLWPNHLVRGGQELMSGDLDLGKSAVHMSTYAACATARVPWPDGSITEPMSVIMLTAEDVLDRTVIPRLMVGGANVNRVHILKCIKIVGEKDRMFYLGLRGIEWVIFRGDCRTSLCST